MTLTAVVLAATTTLLMTRPVARPLKEKVPLADGRPGFRVATPATTPMAWVADAGDAGIRANIMALMIAAVMVKRVELGPQG